jgi:NTE family protein
VAYGDHLLIDGGISNLVPLGTAREFSDSVIVSSTFYDAKNLNLRNPLVILNGSIDIGKRRAGVEDLLRYPDALWIRCAVESFSFMAFDRLADLDAEGYRSVDAVAHAFPSLAGAAERGQAGPGAAIERLASLRAGLEDSLEAAGRAWAPFERAPSARIAWSFAPALRSQAYPGDAWLLNDSLYLGAGLGLRLAVAEAELAGGFSWDAYSGAAPVPGLYAGVELYPVPWLKLEGAALASWPEGMAGVAGSGAGRVALYQNTGFYAALSGDKARLELFSRLELSAPDLDRALGGEYAAGQAMLLTSGADVAIVSAGTPRALAFSAGHQLAGAWDENLAFAELGIALAPVEALALRTTVMARAALEREGRAPFFFSDPFSVADAAAVDGMGRAWLGASVSLGLEPPRAALSFAELLILRRLSFALFADAVWTSERTNPASLALGLRLGCDLSLIGLKSARLLFEAGADPGGDAFFLRFYLAPAGRR